MIKYFLLCGCGGIGSIIAEALPLGDEARQGWRSGQNLAKRTASNKFWAPQAVTRSLSAKDNLTKYADVAELADALDSGSSES